MRNFLVLIGLACLIGCGTASDSLFLSAVRSAADARSRPQVLTDLSAAKASIIQQVRQSGNASSTLIVTLPKRHAVAALTKAGENGDAVTWFDTGGISVVTRRGVVIGTRGLGHDLMIADVEGVLTALDRGAATFSRKHRYLDGEGQLQSSIFSCAMAWSGSTAIENCRGDGVSFENRYERSDAGAGWSRQWLGPDIGYVELEYLS